MKKKILIALFFLLILFSILPYWYLNTDDSIRVSDFNCYYYLGEALYLNKGFINYWEIPEIHHTKVAIIPCLIVTLSFYFGQYNYLIIKIIMLLVYSATLISLFILFSKLKINIFVIIISFLFIISNKILLLESTGPAPTYFLILFSNLFFYFLFNKKYYIATLFAVITYHSKGNGLTLFPILFFDIFLKYIFKNKQKFFKLITICLIIVILLFSFNIYQNYKASSYVRKGFGYSYFSEMLLPHTSNFSIDEIVTSYQFYLRLKRNLSFYFYNFNELTLSTNISNIYFILLIVLIFFIGYIKSIISIKDNFNLFHMHIYIIMNSLIVIVWPWYGLRFLASLIPFFILFFFEGTLYIIKLLDKYFKFHFVRKYSYYIFAVLFLFLLFIKSIETNNYIKELSKPIDKEQKYDFEFKEWIDNNTSEKDTFYFWEPLIIHSYNRRSIRVLFTYDLERFRNHILTYKPNYLIKENKTGFTHANHYLNNYLESYPDDFSYVKTTRDFVVYEVNYSIYLNNHK